MSTSNLVDEFGRDNRLRAPESSFDDIIQMKLSQGKSWAEITWEIEEEEEKELAALDAQRKTLLLKSEYQLEEGEILE
jgi:hypothetical protein